MNRQHRSSQYQAYFHEIPYDPQVMVMFSNEENSLYSIFDTQAEELIELRKKLMQLILVLAKEKLTKRQWQYLTLFLQGYTQVEMTKILKVRQQSCIAKTFNFYGNAAYYGGIVPKLKKLVKTNEEIQALIKKIQELNDRI